MTYKWYEEILDENLSSVILIIVRGRSWNSWTLTVGICGQEIMKLLPQSQTLAVIRIP